MYPSPAKGEKKKTKEGWSAAKMGKMLYLSKQDVVNVGLEMEEIIEALDEAFKEKGCLLYTSPSPRDRS